MQRPLEGDEMNPEATTDLLPGQENAEHQRPEDRRSDAAPEVASNGGLTMIGSDSAAICEDGSCAVPWLNEGTIDAD